MVATETRPAPSFKTDVTSTPDAVEHPRIAFQFNLQQGLFTASTSELLKPTVITFRETTATIKTPQPLAPHIAALLTPTNLQSTAMKVALRNYDPVALDESLKDPQVNPAITVKEGIEQLDFDAIEQVVEDDETMSVFATRLSKVESDVDHLPPAKLALHAAQAFEQHTNRIRQNKPYFLDKNNT